MNRRPTTVLVSLDSAPAFAHVDGAFHAHATDYSALMIGLSLITLAVGAGIIAVKVRK